MQTAGTLEVIVEDPYALEPLPFRHACQYFVDYLAEVITVVAHARRSFEGQRAFVGLRGLQQFDSLRVAASSKIGDCRIHFHRLVGMWAALGSLDSRRHWPLDHQCMRTVVSE